MLTLLERRNIHDSLQLKVLLRPAHSQVTENILTLAYEFHLRAEQGREHRHLSGHVPSAFSQDALDSPPVGALTIS